MKFVWILSGLLLAGFGLFWHRNQTVSPSSTARERSPAFAGAFSETIQPQAIPSDKQVAKSAQLEKIAALARYSLPTQAVRETLISVLSDPTLPTSLQDILSASDQQTFDADQEKMRMSAVSVVGLILKNKDLIHREDMLQIARQRILAVDFDRMKDIRVKQSVYGDITELLMVLKQYDLETFEDLATRISTSNRKVLQTALAASR